MIQWSLRYISAMKRKLANKSLRKQYKIKRHIEKGMAIKEASEKFGMPKNTASTWMGNKDKLFFALQETSSPTKKVVAITKR